MYPVANRVTLSGFNPQLAARLGRTPMGDPGLFSSIGGFLKKATGVAGHILPGPLGAGFSAISGAIPGGSKPVKTSTRRPVMPGTGSVPIIGVGGPSGFQVGTGGISIGGPSGFVIGTAPGTPGPTHMVPVPTSTGGTALVGTQKPGQSCGGGYHWNKTDYFLRDGTYVPKGSKMVRNRRRNPLNPRALSRAISRYEQARHAVTKLGATLPKRPHKKRRKR